MSEAITYPNVDKKLLEAVPEFRPCYDEHLKKYDEVILHMLMYEFSLFFIDTFKKSQQDPASKEVLSRCIDFIESLFASNDLKVQELAQVSFIENLPPEQAQNVRAILRPFSQHSFDLVF